jgi:small-conductance mechanosensitive channel
MNILDIIYFGNSLQSWLVALCILLGVFFLLKIIQRKVISRLSGPARETDNQFDDLLISMLKKTKFFILLIASAYLASRVVVLEPSVESLWQKAVVLLLIIQGGLWAGAGIKFLIGRVLQKKLDQDAAGASTVALLGFVARLVLWIIVALLILGNLGVNITGLIAGLGIGGIAVALAVQNILGDLLASLSIVLDKPFVIGDFIVVGDLSGTVERIGLKTTRVRSISGEQLIFSNNDLLKSRIRNNKRMGQRRIVFTFGIMYSTPLEKIRRAKSIVWDIITKIPQVRLDRVHFKEYGAQALVFETVYFVLLPDYMLYMDIQERINLEIFERFQSEGIEFAYPAQTVFLRQASSPAVTPPSDLIGGK